MAFITVNYVSNALFRTVPVNVILPADKYSADRREYISNPPYKTLYLLHGLLGNYTDWVNGTRIQRYAEERNLAVVMPSGDNSFYVNGVTLNNDYGEFIGKELVEVTRRMFPLSEKREDTFIAGLSMGGFGALRNGLKYADTFGRIAALSGALHILDEDAREIGGESAVFGNLEEARKSDKNPRVLLDHLVHEGKTLPKIYMACGLQDDLLDANRKYRDLILAAGADLTYVEEDGAHEWEFWDRHIKKVIEWLPLDDPESGINSGNVKKG